jgi:hypothetical protein
MDIDICAIPIVNSGLVYEQFISLCGLLGKKRFMIISLKVKSGGSVGSIAAMCKSAI